VTCVNDLVYRDIRDGQDATSNETAELNSELTECLIGVMSQMVGKCWSNSWNLEF